MPHDPAVRAGQLPMSPTRLVWRGCSPRPACAGWGFFRACMTGRVRSFARASASGAHGADSHPVGCAGRVHDQGRTLN